MTATRQLKRRPKVIDAPPAEIAYTAWGTPITLRVSIYIIAALSLVLMAAMLAGARSHRRAVQSVGRDTVPSIVAAENISVLLAEMDGSTIDQLLHKDGSAAAQRLFEARRQGAAEAIVTAAENITSGDSERIPIRKLARGLGAYAAEAQQATDLLKAGDKRFLDVYRIAAEEMDHELLPAAAELEKASQMVLDTAYARETRSSVAVFAFVVIAALALLGMLIALQRFLLLHMRRVLNPALIAATALTIAFTTYSLECFHRTDADLQAAKETDYDSMRALLEARSTASSATVDESRALLDPAQAKADHQRFEEKMDRVAHLAPGSENFSGYLAEALNNVTSPQQREAITGSLRAFQAGGGIDRFGASLGPIINEDQTAFHREIDDAFTALSGLEIGTPILALLVPLLAFLGVLPRLREYSA